MRTTPLPCPPNRPPDELEGAHRPAPGPAPIPTSTPPRHEEDAMHTHALSDTLTHAKWAYTTRRVPQAAARSLLPLRHATEAGDLVLARVDILGQHDGLQLRSGRRAQLHVGDLIVLCLGNRYAPDQFEGVCTLRDEQAELLAAGGLAGTVRHRHARMRPATRLTVQGALGDGEGRTLNLAQHALPPLPPLKPRMPVIVVAGTSMNAGKTTTCAQVIRGLGQIGQRVGAAKITGTGSMGDAQTCMDAGALQVLDFTDAGLASTYKVDPVRIEALALRLIDELERSQCTMAVVEIADGLLQDETEALLRSASFRARCQGLVFAAGDAMGAVAGVQRVHELGWQVLGLSGLLSASPLALVEATRALAAAGLDVPGYTRGELQSPAVASRLSRKAHAALHAADEAPAARASGAEAIAWRLVA